MKHRYALVLPALLALASASSQIYCAPTFDLGCSLWHNQSITLGDIDWTSNSDCTDADHSSLSTIVDPGETLPMMVTSGNWTGCAVWVDFNHSNDFDDSENLYYMYVGGDPGYTYSFDITIPPGTPGGSYRLRVVAPWGSDGFLTTNTNGYGACGAYQYGNFDDFTLVVSGPESIAEARSAGLSVGPNPTAGMVNITSEANNPVERIVLLDVTGRPVLYFTPEAPTANAQLDLGALPAGPYHAQCYLASGTRTVRVVKD